MNLLPDEQPRPIPEKFAADFIKELKLNAEVERRCEWSCLLWLKDHWASEAQKAKISVEHTKERLSTSPENTKTTEMFFLDSQFLNTVAQVYSKLFDGREQSCTVKNFPSCPFMDQREDLLIRGLLANTFVTILQKATFYAMLERHPLDSGLLHEEYTDVYGIDLTNFDDLEASLRDRRFDKLYRAVVNRASQLAGLEREPSL